MRNKRLIYRLSNGIITIAIVAILIIVNIFVKDANWKIDLTQSSMYTLTKETIDYIKTIDVDTKIMLLQKEEDQADYITKIVELYHKYNSKIKVTRLDPDKNPALLDKYLQKDNTLVYGSIVVDNGKNWDVINKYGLVIRDAEGNITSKVERKITSTLYKINSEGTNIIYTLIGHGERSIDELSEITSYLQDINYEAKEINLLSQPKIPEDIYSLAIIGPTKDISESERDIILDYLKKGGKVTIAIDVDVTNVNYNNIKAIAQEYNLSIDDNYICEGKGHYTSDLQLALLPKLEQNEITRNIYYNKLNILMPFARSISIIDEKNEDIQILPILTTSKDSWGETDFSVAPKKDKKDKEGPFNIAVAAVKNIEKGKDSKLVIFGNSNIIGSEILGRYATLGNRDVFVTTVKWFDDKDTNLLDVSEKISKVTSYAASKKTSQKLLWGAIVVPLVFATCGVFTYVKRRD